LEEEVQPSSAGGKRDSLCKAALVLGIVAVVVPFAELLLAVPTITLAISGLRRVKRQPHLHGSRGMAVAGLILGLLALLLCVPSIIILIHVF
jgi:hypothetical protein